MMKTTIISAAMMVIAVAPLAQAGHSGFDGKRRSKDHIWARVVDVREVYDEHVESVPVEKCTIEKSVQHSSRGSATPAILGGIIGGAVGNSLGNHKSSQKVGAVVGAVLGASIGHDIGDSHHVSRHHHGHRKRKRCETHYEQTVHKRVIGYDVDYRHRGRIYTTYRKHYPGKRIRVISDWGHGDKWGRKQRECHHKGKRYRDRHQTYHHWY